MNYSLFKSMLISTSLRNFKVFFSLILVSLCCAKKIFVSFKIYLDVLCPNIWSILEENPHIFWEQKASGSLFMNILYKSCRFAWIIMFPSFLISLLLCSLIILTIVKQEILLLQTLLYNKAEIFLPVCFSRIFFLLLMEKCSSLI